MASKIVLFYRPLSPPSRAVLLTAKAIGLNLELKDINVLTGEHLTPEFRKLNPQHTIPTINDNGIVVYDSHAISAYLVDKYSDNDSLYPKDLVRRAHVNSRLHFNSGFLFARLRYLFEPIFFMNEDVIPEWKVEYIQKCWIFMEEFLEKGNYVCGDELTIADFCCIATVSSIDKIAVIDPVKFPRLLAWTRRMQAIPFYSSENAKGAAAFQKSLLSTVAKRKAELTNKIR
ncbi:hypothetical protein HA402_012891 [Bradysia odoriphaga]|nr:hypothetical protein HA402_012891 [Bradysia odoriphaga]